MTPCQRRRRARPELERLEDKSLWSGTPLGAAFDVTGVYYGNQQVGSDRTVARAGNGKFAVTWSGLGGSGVGIYARLYSAGGSPLTGPMRISGTGGADSSPTVAMSDNGQFAVAWTRQASAANSDVLVQRFASSGAPSGGVTTVAGSPWSESQPSAAMDATGHLVVAYSYYSPAGNWDVYAWYRRTTGAAGVFAVANTPTDEYQPSAALNDSGQGVVAYTYNFSKDSAGFVTDRDVYAQRIGRTAKVGSVIPVAFDGLHEADASAAINNSGTFAVAFTRYREERGALSGLVTSSQVLARRYSNTGGFLNEVAVGESWDTRFESAPSVAVTYSGAIVVAYQHEYSDSDRDVRGHVFNSSGVALGGSFFISGSGSFDELTPTVALADNGTFVCAFATYGEKLTQGNDFLGTSVSARLHSLA
jgi:hypothetical protein